MQFEIIDGNRGTKRLGMATFGDMTIAAACKKKFINLENKYVTNKFHQEINPNTFVKDVNHPCIYIVDGIAFSQFKHFSSQFILIM